MKTSLFRGKSTRTKIFTVITTAVILVLFCVNLLLGYVFLDNMLYLDFTPEGFYTLSDKMVKACEDILNKTNSEGDKKEIKITFLCEPDYLVGNEHMRTTYFMALSLKKMFDNVTVETVDVLRNPTAVSMYKTTSKASFKTTDMIVSYGAKYRVVDADGFWSIDSNDREFSYDGEYRMVSILASLTAIDQPIVYFLTGHGESFYNPEDPDNPDGLNYSALYDLLTECGLKVKTLNLSDPEVDRVPEDCALLIINDPREDLVTDPGEYGSFNYVSEAEKIDRFLISNAGAVIVNKGNDVDLPVLESYLEEWGIGFSDSLVKDVENSLNDIGEAGTTILGVYDKSDDGLGGAYYSEYSMLDSSPKVVFTNTGYIYNAYEDSDASGEAGGYKTSRIYNHFLGTSDKAMAYNALGEITSSEGMKSLAVMSSRDYLDGEVSEHFFSYVFCTNSSEFFTNDVLGNHAYANYSVMATVINNISRTDRFASIELGGGSPNSPSFGGKQVQTTVLSETDTKIYSWDAMQVVTVNKGFTTADRALFTVIVFVAPLVAFLSGIAMFIKRKFL